MAGRLCGYCRVEGHQMPVCPIKEEHRQTIVNHVKGERKFLISHMERVGLGLGATIKVFPSYGDPNLSTYVLTGADWIRSLTPVRQRKVRYSKQVNIGRSQVIDRNDAGEISSDQWGYVSVEALSLERNKIVGFNLNAKGIAKPIMLDALEEMPTSYSKSLYILSPSNEPYELTEADYGKHIPIHRRLLTKEQVAKMSRWDDVKYLDF